MALTMTLRRRVERLEQRQGTPEGFVAVRCMEPKECDTCTIELEQRLCNLSPGDTRQVWLIVHQRIPIPHWR